MSGDRSAQMPTLVPGHFPLLQEARELVRPVMQLENRSSECCRD